MFTLTIDQLKSKDLVGYYDVNHKRWKVVRIGEVYDDHNIVKSYDQEEEMISLKKHKLYPLNTNIISIPFTHISCRGLGKYTSTPFTYMDIKTHQKYLISN